MAHRLAARLRQLEKAASRKAPNADLPVNFFAFILNLYELRSPAETDKEFIRRVRGIDVDTDPAAFQILYAHHAQQFFIDGGPGNGTP